MTFENTSIPGILVFNPKVFSDQRGFIMETYREDVFAGAGITGPFVQDNQSGSKQGTLRGLHYQIRQAQGKLIRTVAGEIFDVAVDLRRNSPTLGQWIGVVLSVNNKKQIWIPPGFAHGYYILSEWADVVYKNTDYYAPEWERCLMWNDPALGIEWPLLQGKSPVLSDKDSRGKAFHDLELFD